VSKGENMKGPMIFGRVLLVITWIGMAAWITIIYTKQKNKGMNVSSVPNERVIAPMAMEMVRIPAGTFQMGTNGNTLQEVDL